MPKLEVAATLRGSWGQWISGQPWDLFVTLTSEKQTHPEAMLKRFRYCMHKASDSVYGRRWSDRGLGLQWVVGLERTKQGWPHSHAVVRFPTVDIRGAEGRAVFPLGEWQKRMTNTGGFAWLEIPRSEQAVVQYVTKYVVKDGELELSPTVDFALAPGTQILMDPARTPTGRTVRPAVAPSSTQRPS